MNSKTYFTEEAVKAYALHGYSCLICGEKATQLAHGLPQRKELLARYGWRVVHSRYNRFPACSLECNAKLQCRASGDRETEKLARQIMRKISQEENTQ